jgi:type IVB pilus formation R64 PilN family outer membrane protein
MKRLVITQRGVLFMLVVGVTTGCANTKIDVGSAQTKALTQQAVDRAATLQPLPIGADTPGTASQANAQAQAIAQRPIAMRATSPWVGKRTVAVQSDAALPAIFGESFAFHFDDRAQAGRVGIAQVAERLSRMTGVPVRVKQDIYSNAPGNASGNNSPATPTTATALPAPMPFQAQVGLPLELPASGASAFGQASSKASSATKSPVNYSGGQGTVSMAPLTAVVPIAGPSIEAMQMRWDGTLTGFLDHVTGLLNLSWAYREGVVVIERLVTETFEITAFGGTQEYRVQISGGNDGKGTFGGSSSVLDVQEQGKLTALESLKRALDQLVTPSGGSVSLNEGSGRFTVMAPRDTMARVRELVRSEDASLRRQAHIQFDVYSVVGKDEDQYGVDWSPFVGELMKSWGAKIKSPASLVGTGAASLTYAIAETVADSADPALKSKVSRYGGSSALLQALHQVGDTAQYRPISMVAMNRQWARKTNLKVTGYVAETTPATSTGAGSGSPGLKTSSVTTGDKFLVQPAIMDDGTIYLKFGVSLTDLLGLFNVNAGSGSSLQTVQTPETSGTDDQGTIRLSPGESMVITGLSRRVAQTDRSGLTQEAPIALGGSIRRNYKREDFLIVVRAVPI